MSEAEAEARQHFADVQKIEQSTEHLEHTMEEAREAVHRAHEADTMASPYEQNAVSDAEPGGGEDQSEVEETDSVTEDAEADRRAEKSEESDR